MTGSLIIAAPTAQIVAQSSSEEDEVIDFSLSENVRQHVLNFAKHRKPEDYRLIVERTSGGNSSPWVPINMIVHRQELGTAMTQDQCDIQIRGGVLVNSKELRLADVFIRNGVIDSCELPQSGKKARQVIDAKGKFVLPGIVEAHLHPVYADRLDTLSKAAVYGGITTLIPYIGAVKAWGVEGNLWDAVNYFIDEGARDSVIDFGLHCSLVSGDMAELENLVPNICARGVRSFKGFMAYKKRGMYLNDRDLLRILSALKDNGGLFCVHAENGDLCDFLEEGFAAAGKTGPEYYGPSRPGSPRRKPCSGYSALPKFLTVRCTSSTSARRKRWT